MLPAYSLPIRTGSLGGHLRTRMVVDRPLTGRTHLTVGGWKGILDDQEASTDSDLLSPEDVEDLERARRPRSRSKKKRLAELLGPGLITGMADDDPSGVGTYSAIGAQFGYLLLWLVPVSIPLMIAVQEMCARVGLITGEGLAAVIRRHYPKWLLYGAVTLLLAANVINIYADLNAMAAAMQMLFGASEAVWLTVLTTALSLSIIFIPYVRYVTVLKWLCLTLLAYVIVGFIPGSRIDWRAAATHLAIPTVSLEPSFVLAAVGFLGTTISPYLFFWQASEEVEEEIADRSADGTGRRLRRLRPREVRKMVSDTVVGMIASQTVAFFIVVVAAATLHASGKTDIETAQDAAKALLPLGRSAYTLFTLGIVSTGLLGIPALAGSVAYAVSETFGWKSGLYRRYGRARAFYLTIASVVVLGFLLNFVHSISPVKGLLYSAALNGMVAPPLIVVLLFICNNRKIVHHRTNGLWSNLLGWTAVALMGISSLFLLYAILTGAVG